MKETKTCTASITWINYFYHLHCWLRSDLTQVHPWSYVTTVWACRYRTPSPPSFTCQWTPSVQKEHVCRRAGFVLHVEKVWPSLVFCTSSVGCRAFSSGSALYERLLVDGQLVPACCRWQRCCRASLQCGRVRCNTSLSRFSWWFLHICSFRWALNCFWIPIHWYHIAYILWGLIIDCSHQLLKFYRN